MALQRLAFFRKEGDALRAELEAYLPTARYDSTNVLSYLKGATTVACVPGVTFDVFAREKKVSGSGSIYSDGTWAWTDDLAYYVEHYNLRLPDALFEHMKTNQWRVPANVSVRESDVIELIQ